MPSATQPIPAAAVAFVRDAKEGIEVYLSRRPMHFRYYPGAFVFPGGRRDAGDSSLKETAWREVREEIGVELDTTLLVPLRNILTSAHAGPVYHMLTFAYPVEGDFATRINPEEIDEEIWAPAHHALAALDLPYQIRAAVRTIAQYPTVVELLRALEAGSIDEDYWF